MVTCGVVGSPGCGVDRYSEALAKVVTDRDRTVDRKHMYLPVDSIFMQ